MRKTIPTAAVFLLIILASCWSLFNPHLFPLHDYVHAARIAEMARGLADGQVPVRWSSNFGYGYGMPLFEFYAPLPYYLGAFVYMLGMPIALVVRLLFVICSVATMVGAYRLGSTLWGRTAGLLVAAAYTLAPYRAVNLFVRGALGEAFGMMALPWVLYACLLVWQRRPRAWIVLTLSLVTLFLSHNLVTLMAVPCIAVWVIATGLLQNKQKKKEFWTGLLQISGSTLLAAALSAFYLVPAFLEKQFTKVESLITTGYFDYHVHFLYLRQFVNPTWKYGGSGWGVEDGFSFFFGWGQWLGLVFLGVVVVRNAKQIWQKQRALAWLLGVIGALLALSLLLTTFKTLPLWEAVPLFTYIQFPWRFMSIATLFIALLASAFLTQLSSGMRKATGTLLLIILLLNGWYFRPEKYLDNDDALYYSDAGRIRTEMSGILPDFIPAQMTKFIEETPNDGSVLLCQLLANCPTDVTILVDRGHEKLLSMTLPEAQDIALAVAGFPGWIAELDGEPREWSFSTEGLMQVAVPAGTHTIGVRWAGTPLRIASDWTTGLAILVFCTVLWREHDRDQRNT